MTLYRTNISWVFWLSATASAVLLLGCNSDPVRVDPTGNEAITTMGLDYGDSQEIATNMADQLLQSQKLSAYRTGPKSILARYNNTVNKSSIPDRDLPVSMVTTAIRSRLIRSGEFEFTAALETAEGADPSVREARELANDPMFDQTTVQESGSMGTVDAPRLSVNSELLSAYSANQNDSQRTFELRVWVVDLKNGRTIWENTSKPISKRSRR
jgi:PBP1b-binding outer membrane lipoprotein LpoB